MKRWLASFFLVAASCLIPASAQALWGGAEYGMSVAETLDQVEGARLVESDASKPGAVEGARVDGLMMFGVQFKAGFYFSDERLIQVILSPDEALSADQGVALYRNIIEGLRSKYGQEISDNDGESPFLKTRTWMHGKTNITASIMTRNEKLLVLGVAYQTRISKESELL